jgi:2-polyprenyl-6-methoxyphenol hydroxylase-like FAD-dependent oxidoreductase
MMLAAELALAKVDVAVVERRPDHVLVGSRSGGFHSRTTEVLDQRGVADRFLAEGQVARTAMFPLAVLGMSDFPTRHRYGLGILQNQIERNMAAWIAELPVRIYYGCEVTGCPTRGSTELETPATRPTTAVRRGTAAPEVSR